MEDKTEAQQVKRIPRVQMLQQESNESTRRLGRDSFQLTNVTAKSFPNVVITSDYRISLRSDNVFCLDELPLGRICSGIFHRCDRAN